MWRWWGMRPKTTQLLGHSSQPPSVNGFWLDGATDVSDCGGFLRDTTRLYLNDATLNPTSSYCKLTNAVMDIHEAFECINLPLLSSWWMLRSTFRSGKPLNELPITLTWFLVSNSSWKRMHTYYNWRSSGSHRADLNDDVLTTNMLRISQDHQPPLKHESALFCNAEE